MALYASNSVTGVTLLKGVLMPFVLISYVYYVGSLPFLYLNNKKWIIILYFEGLLCNLALTPLVHVRVHCSNLTMISVWRPTHAITPDGTLLIRCFRLHPRKTQSRPSHAHHHERCTEEVIRWLALSTARRALLSPGINACWKFTASSAPITWNEIMGFLRNLHDRVDDSTTQQRV